MFSQHRHAEKLYPRASYRLGICPGLRTWISVRPWDVRTGPYHNILPVIQTWIGTYYYDFYSLQGIAINAVHTCLPRIPKLNSTGQ